MNPHVQYQSTEITHPGIWARTQGLGHSTVVANNHVAQLPPIHTQPPSIFHGQQRPIAYKYTPSHGTGSSTMMPQQPSKKPSPDNEYDSKYLKSELKRIANPRRRQSQPVFAESQRHHHTSSPESLKKDLLDIVHRRNMHVQKKTKKRRPKKTIHPLYEQDGRVDGHSLIDALTSIDAMHGHDLGSYTKDYIQLSRDYKKMETYRITKRGSNHHPTCVNCSRPSRNFNKVFFPCEHICVCNTCLSKKMPKRCPLCNAAISIVVNHTGNEEEDYWTWVEEVKPSISTSFIKSFFVQSKDTIRSAMAGDLEDYSSHRSSNFKSIISHVGDRDMESELTHMQLIKRRLSCLKFLLLPRRASVSPS